MTYCNTSLLEVNLTCICTVDLLQGAYSQHLKDMVPEDIAALENLFPMDIYFDLHIQATSWTEYQVSLADPCPGSVCTVK